MTVTIRQAAVPRIINDVQRWELQERCLVVYQRVDVGAAILIVPVNTFTEVEITM